LWAYDHSLRMPPAGSLEEQLAGGSEAAAQSFVDSSRARLELVDDWPLAEHP
jgi:hypothetical protein